MKSGKKGEKGEKEGKGEKGKKSEKGKSVKTGKRGKTEKRGQGKKGRAPSDNSIQEVDVHTNLLESFGGAIHGAPASLRLLGSPQFMAVRQSAQVAALRILKTNPNPTLPRVSGNDPLEPQSIIGSGNGAIKEQQPIFCGWLGFSPTTPHAHRPSTPTETGWNLGGPRDTPKLSTPAWTRANLDRIVTPRPPVAHDALPSQSVNAVLVPHLGRSRSWSSHGANRCQSWCADAPQT